MEHGAHGRLTERRRPPSAEFTPDHVSPKLGPLVDARPDLEIVLGSLGAVQGCSHFVTFDMEPLSSNSLEPGNRFCQRMVALPQRLIMSIDCSGIGRPELAGSCPVGVMC